MPMDANAIAKRWAERLSQSGGKITEGVRAVQVAPAHIAADHLDRYVQGTQEAVNSGKMAAALRRSTLSDWQNGMIQKGITRIGQGATQAIPKMTVFLQAFLPWVAQGKAMVDAMPKGGVENGVARAAAMIRHNAAFKR